MRVGYRLECVTLPVHGAVGVPRGDVAEHLRTPGHSIRRRGSCLAFLSHVSDGRASFERAVSGANRGGRPAVPPPIDDSPCRGRLHRDVGTTARSAMRATRPIPTTTQRVHGVSCSEGRNRESQREQGHCRRVGRSDCATKPLLRPICALLVAREGSTVRIRVGSMLAARRHTRSVACVRSAQGRVPYPRLRKDARSSSSRILFIANA